MLANGGIFDGHTQTNVAIGFEQVQPGKLVINPPASTGIHCLFGCLHGFDTHGFGWQGEPKKPFLKEKNYKNNKVLVIIFKEM